MPRRAATLLVACLSLLVISCGVSNKHYVRLDAHMAASDCGGALEYFSGCGDEYGGNARLLYLLDKGTVLLLCGEYADSAETLNEADQLAEELWTVSLTKEAATFVTNEYSQAYGGEDFEKAMINIMAAVDYVLMGRPNDALVECRRLDEKLAGYNDKYEDKNVYREDAFGRYLSGLIYESQGELNDAYIDYRKAYQTYIDYAENYGTSMPGYLVRDLARLAERLGFREDLKDYREAFPDLAASPQAEHSARGRAVLVQFDGRVPRKVQDRVTVYSDAGPITLAFPRFEVMSGGSTGMDLALSTPGGQDLFAGSSFLAEDIQGIAIKNLEDRKGRTVAKAIARAVIKQAAFHGISKAASDDESTQRGVRALFNLANQLLEQADTRSWRTLPARIYIASVSAPPGDYQASARAEGMGISSDLGPVSLEAGKTVFLFLNTMY